MKKQHTQKMTVRVTAQTAYNLERLMLMSGQEASYCNHPKCPPPGPLLFYGKTAPRYCPLRKKGENT